eukprot:scaffold190_cov171-Amphora_coffeaeformis.AAC.40
MEIKAYVRITDHRKKILLGVRRCDKRLVDDERLYWGNVSGCWVELCFVCGTFGEEEVACFPKIFATRERFPTTTHARGDDVLRFAFFPFSGYQSCKLVIDHPTRSRLKTLYDLRV